MVRNVLPFSSREYVASKTVFIANNFIAIIDKEEHMPLFIMKSIGCNFLCQGVPSFSHVCISSQLLGHSHPPQYHSEYHRSLYHLWSLNVPVEKWALLSYIINTARHTRFIMLINLLGIYIKKHHCNLMQVKEFIPSILQRPLNFNLIIFSLS